MANIDNLKKGNPETQFTSGRVAVEAQRKSAEKRKQNTAEKKLIKDRILERMQAEDWDEYIDGIIARAKESKADAEFLRDTIGERPSDKVELSVNDDSAKEMNEYFARHSKTTD